jgi:hypothetical protein
MKLTASEGRLTALLAHRVHRSLEKLHVADPGNLHRVLEGEEEARAGALLGIHRQQVLAVERHAARPSPRSPRARQHMAEGALAGAVRAHDGVHLPGVDLEVEAAQDILASTRACRLSIFNIIRLLTPCWPA